MARYWDRFKVTGDELLGRVRSIVREGNVRRVVVKQGSRTVVEFPVTVGVVGALAAPSLAALGAIAAFLTECTVEIEREAAEPREPAPSRRTRGGKGGRGTSARPQSR
jgi:hypothetical protein